MAATLRAEPAAMSFHDGWRALERAFPTLVAEVPFSPFYVCPICLHAFPAEALRHRLLTLDHVPPRSVGGKRLVLTCKKCNSKGGHELDAHMIRESDFIEFATLGAFTNRRAKFTTPAGTVPVRLSVSGSGIRVDGLPKANRRAHDKVFSDIERAACRKEWEDRTFTIGFEPFSEPKAALSWLRSAYLMFFAAFGYRFIFRPEMHTLRLKILNADTDSEPTIFRIVRPESLPPALVRIEEPPEAGCYAMFYRHNMVFLPKRGDTTLYERLRGVKKGAVISGPQIEWPKRPRFAADFQAVAPKQE